MHDAVQTRCASTALPPIARSRVTAILQSAALAGVIVAIAGCEVRADRNQPANAAQQAANPAPQSTTVIQGGGSSLGKARNSAKSVEQKFDQHNRELEKQIEDLSP